MQFLLSQCNASFAQYGSVLLTLFMAGLVGGLTHCAGMCGPFVFAQVKCGNQYQTNLQKLAGAALLPYHLGRMTTYIFLGIVAVTLSKQIMGLPVYNAVSFTFLVVAGSIFIMSAIPKAKGWFGKIGANYFSAFGQKLGCVAKPLLLNQTNFKRYLLGVLLGFLPCGLIFAVLMVVATMGDIFFAIIAITLFTMGTFPSMLLVAVGSQSVFRRWPVHMQMFARAVMIFNGLGLFILAGKLFFN